MTLNETRRIEEDCNTNIIFDIVENETVVGGCSIMVDEKSAYCERIDIDEEYRNNGYGTSALNALSDMFGGIMVAPDNEDARRLYERIGYEYGDESTPYIDNGYGVYKI